MLSCPISLQKMYAQRDHDILLTGSCQEGARLLASGRGYANTFCSALKKQVLLAEDLTPVDRGAA